MNQHASRDPARRRTRGVRTAVLVGLATVLMLAGCGGGSSKASAPPEDVMAKARSALDETSGVHVSLTTDELPDGVDGVLEATGIGTHAPAFEGEIKALASGIRVTV